VTSAAALYEVHRLLVFVLRDDETDARDGQTCRKPLHTSAFTRAPSSIASYVYDRSSFVLQDSCQSWVQSGCEFNLIRNHA
jgi:hypothetical protein